MRIFSSTAAVAKAAELITAIITPMTLQWLDSAIQIYVFFLYVRVV